MFKYNIYNFCDADTMKHPFSARCRGFHFSKVTEDTQDLTTNWEFFIIILRIRQGVNQQPTAERLCK